MINELGAPTGSTGIVRRLRNAAKANRCASKLLAGSFASKRGLLPAPQETLTNGDCRPHSEPAAFLSRDRTSERVAAWQDACAHGRQHGPDWPDPCDSADRGRVHARAAALSDRLLDRREPDPNG